MEGKRKAAGSPIVDGDLRSAKRTKLPPGVIDPSQETAETTTEAGLKFIENLRNARDKTGRPVATEFLTLPDRDLIPEYYQEIRLPLAIDTIEEKLRRAEYANISALEADVKRMVSNAKLFNDKRSAVYEDAERVRKTASNWFTRYNPAYRDPNYQAVATPIPGEANGITPVPPRPKLSISNESRATPVKVQTPATASPAPSMSKTKSTDAGADTSGDNGDSSDFVGKSFLQAQDKILEELIHYTDEDQELEIFTPFVNLPSRSLVDYYQVIKHPVSLKGVQRKVRGVHGRSAPTWVTDFKSWDSFEQEVSYIWKNAREYNEDGSEIFELAGELEQAFQKRLADAKAVVEQPPQTKLKINAPAPAKIPIKLSFNRSAHSPSTTSRPATPADGRGTPGVIVDNEALARQQRMVAAAANGQRPPSSGAAAAAPPVRSPFNGAKTGVSSVAVPALPSRYQNIAVQSPPLQANGIKTEVRATQSPGLTAIRPVTHAPHVGASVMPPPSGLTQRLPSGSPHPQAPLGYHHGATPHHSPGPYQGPLQSLVENRVRPAGQSAANSIMPSLSLSSHPQLQLSKPFHLKIPASNSQTQQSLTVTVPSSVFYLQIVPFIPVALTSRPYRVFVLVNGQRQSELVKPGGDRDKQRPLFEARLERGVVNRIEVEVLAGKERKNAAGKEEVEMEKCTVFLHVMR